MQQSTNKNVSNKNWRKFKLVVNGDPSQVDLINKTHSGLIKSKNILKNLKEIKIIEFDHNDVVRHPLVSKIIRAYQNKSTDDKDNVITNYNKWFYYIKNPNNYVDRKIIKLNKKNKQFVKNKIFCTLLLSNNKNKIS